MSASAGSQACVSQWIPADAGVTRPQNLLYVVLSDAPIEKSHVHANVGLLHIPIVA